MTKPNQTEALVQKQGRVSEQRHYIPLCYLALGLKFQSIHVFHMHVWNVDLRTEHDMEKRVYCQLLSHRAVVRQVTSKTAAECHFLTVVDRHELESCRIMSQNAPGMCCCSLFSFHVINYMSKRTF